MDCISNNYFGIIWFTISNFNNDIVIKKLKKIIICLQKFINFWGFKYGI